MPLWSRGERLGRLERTSLIKQADVGDTEHFRLSVINCWGLVAPVGPPVETFSIVMNQHFYTHLKVLWQSDIPLL